MCGVVQSVSRGQPTTLPKSKVSFDSTPFFPYHPGNFDRIGRRQLPGGAIAGAAKGHSRRHARPSFVSMKRGSLSKRNKEVWTDG